MQTPGLWYTNPMKSIAFYSLTVFAGLILAGAVTAADTYRWVDEKGIVHYGDSVPSEFARQDQQVLNSQGVTISIIEGYRTQEQREEQARIRYEQERIAREKAKRQARDSVLLNTYLSVEEIERLS